MTLAPGDWSPQVRQVMQLLDREWVYRHVLRAHDQARESFHARSLSVATAGEFADAVAGYVQHHVRKVEGTELSPTAAAGLAVGVLREGFERGALADGYLAALAAGLGKTQGGMPDVFNGLARGLRERALRNHVEAVFHAHIDPLSARSCRALARALHERYAGAFARLGQLLDEVLVSQEPLRVLWRIREALEHVLSRMEVA